MSEYSLNKDHFIIFCRNSTILSSVLTSNPHSTANLYKSVFFLFKEIAYFKIYYLQTLFIATFVQIKENSIKYLRKAILIIIYLKIFHLLIFSKQNKQRKINFTIAFTTKFLCIIIEACHRN